MLLARLPLLLSLILIAALIGIFSWQGFNIYQEVYKKQEISKPSTSQEVKVNNPVRPNRNIAAYKLFGDPSVKPKEIKPITKDLPKTKLKLTLTGVMTAEIPEQASALIQGPDKQTQHYKVNDELPGGATLKQVFSDRVVVERSGRLENLVFVEQRSIGIEKFVDYRDTEEETSPAPAVQKGNSVASKKTRTNPARTQGIKERLSKLRQKMLKSRPSQ